MSQGIFATTHWSVVLAADHGEEALADAALTRLCQIYRPPILAYALGRGLNVEDAEDLTQGFFAHFIQSNVARKVQRLEGTKFRSFLLRYFKNHIAKEHERRLARKRGGGQRIVSLDDSSPDGAGSGPEAVDERNAERLYERAWATALLEDVMRRLEADYRRRGKQALFDRLQPLLLERKAAMPQAGIARDLSLSEESVRTEISRMRRRYRNIFRLQIAHTVSSPAEIEDEMRRLFALICS